MRYPPAAPLLPSIRAATPARQPRPLRRYGATAVRCGSYGRGACQRRAGPGARQRHARHVRPGTAERCQQTRQRPAGDAATPSFLCWCDVKLFYATSRRAVACVAWRVALQYSGSYRAVACHAVSHSDMSCRTVLSRHVTPCHVAPHHVTSRHAKPCCASPRKLKGQVPPTCAIRPAASGAMFELSALALDRPRPA